MAIRDYFVPGLAKLLWTVGALLAYVGLMGAIVSVGEQGWFEGLFVGKTAAFLPLIAVGAVVLKLAYPLLPPSSRRTRARS